MLFWKGKPKETLASVPVHVGIVMDGNGRWAKKRGLPRKAGHSFGAQTFKKITTACARRGIQYLTVYAFSTENWKRPKDEVESIMKILRDYLNEINRTRENDEEIQIQFIGDRQPLDEDIQSLMAQAEEDTRSCKGMKLNIAINYGGRAELVQCIKAAVLGGETLAYCTEETFEKYLYTKGQPQVDLVIRPSGEYRTSNFLIWQTAYAEYYFTEVLWPDFSERHLDRALYAYAKRHRRFGGI